MRIRPLLIALLLLFVAACGGDDDDDATTSNDTTESAAEDDTTQDTLDETEPADAADCPILKSEIEAVVGFEVSELRAESGAGTQIGCIVDFADGTGSIAVRVYEGAAEESHQAFLSAFEDAEELDVLGRTAAWAEGVGVLDIVDGDDGIQIQVVEAMEDDIPDERQAAIDLAGVVLASR